MSRRSTEELPQKRGIAERITETGMFYINTVSITKEEARY